MSLDLSASALGHSITADDVVDTLSFFDDWEQRYQYIIDLGKSLPTFPDDLRTDERLVRGCQSQVWLEVAHDAASQRMDFGVDSDALIVRGLGAIVLAAINHRSPADVLAFDMEDYFARIDLLKHLSPTRGNGIRAMVARIRAAAETAQG